MHSIDERLLAFVAWHGAIPADASRLEDYQARQHAASWVRRFIGEGSVSYVIGFTLNDRWWTLFFDRVDEPFVPEGAEAWNIEFYASDGKSWSERYFYWPEDTRWRHELFAECGDEYGRHEAALRGEEAVRD